MSRSRRRNKGSTISLFAFQDIMAAIIGVLFLVVLLMSLQLTIEGAEQVEHMENPDELRAKLDELKTYHENISAEVEALNQQIDAVRNPEKVTNELLRMRRRLEFLNDRIQEEAQRSSDMEEKTREVKDAIKELTEKKKELEAEAESAAQEVDTKANVTFIKASGTLKPWLVEITNRSIRAALSDDPSNVIEFAAINERRRRDDFIGWAERAVNDSTHYFVLFMKPSGYDTAMALINDLQNSGYDFGRDLIPEDQILF